ncbi:MAG: glycosyltransferase [Bryobacteraceae bacterium]
MPIPLIVICVIAFALAFLSLRNDGARMEWVKAAQARVAALTRCPPATVIVPVKGGDEFLAANLASLAAQDYPNYELIVAARSAADIPDGVAPPRARVVHSGDGDANTGEKINNLLAAVAAARPESMIFAFADSDNEVSPRWLRALAVPLMHPANGCSTGYRWHLPEPPDFWSSLRSVWNSVIAGEFHGRACSFCWGGAMAVRRETFFKARVPEFWRNAISDDFQMSAAMHAARLPIVYAPGALVVDRSHTGGGEFLRWIERQMIITRVYHPRIWRFSLAAHVVYCTAMVSLAVWQPWLLAALLALGMFKSWRRARIAEAALESKGAWFRRHGWIYAAMMPLATWVWMYSFLASARTSVISWRGHRYRLSKDSVQRR